MTDAAKLARLEKGIAEAKTKLNKRRAELRAKDLERRKREFNKLPLEQRKAFEAVGWSPYQDGAVIRRECGAFTAK